MTYIFKTILYSTLIFVFIACKGAAPKLPKSPHFQQGYNHGCTTAKGDYRKDSKAFRNNADYYNGWFYGRKHCNQTH